MRGNTADLKRAVQRLRTGLIVAVLLVVLFGVIAAVFFVDLETIGPCNGGLGLGVTTCPGPTPPFMDEQLGHSRMENGSYVCNVIVYSPSSAAPYSTALTIWAQTLSGTRLNLTGVALQSVSGSLLANYSPSGTNWTTGQRVGIAEPDILTITSSTALVGQQLVLLDRDSGFAASLLVS